MRRLILLLLVIAAGGGAYWYFAVREPAAVAAANAARRGAGVTPVLVVPAETRDVPVYLDGLGTVQASQSVTMKPQVDGRLIEVNFTEGQEVKAGQVLARIDPRAYQAAMDQAMAKKAQDQANLANAKLDVARYAKLQANAYSSAQQYDTARALAAELEAQVAGDQAAIDTARVNLSYTTLTAPIAGRIGIRQVDVGNIVHELALRRRPHANVPVQVRGRHHGRARTERGKVERRLAQHVARAVARVDGPHAQRAIVRCRHGHAHKRKTVTKTSFRRDTQTQQKSADDIDATRSFL
jgi:multidrug efflux pump subunit AcrA (membrane-fusion protein)